MKAFIKEFLCSALRNACGPRMTVLLWRPFFWVIKRKSFPGTFSLQALRVIAVIRLEATIGDIVLTIPFLRELRKNCPKARIILIIDPANLELLSSCPYIDEILAYRRLVARTWSIQVLKDYFHPLFFSMRHLWKRKIDLAVMPRRGMDLYGASRLAYLSAASYRAASSTFELDKAAVAESSKFEIFFNLLYTDKPIAHEIIFQLNFLRHLGGTIHDVSLRFWPSILKESKGRHLLNSLGYDPEKKLILVGFSAGQALKVWPIERFISLARKLREVMSCQFLLLGNVADTELALKFQEALNPDVINLIGKLDRADLPAIACQCTLYIGNDTGFMHIAAANNIPVLEIRSHARTCSPMDSNSPDRFGPYGVAHITVRPNQPLPPCTTGCVTAQPHCILQVDIEEAWNELQNLIKPLGLSNSSRG